MTSASKNRPLRIAFTNLASTQWTAGTHYLKNLFIALKSLDSSDRPEIVLVVPHLAQPNSYNSLSDYIDQLLYVPPDPPPFIPKFWQRQMIRIQKKLGTWQEPEPILDSYLREHQVDSLFATIDFCSRFSVPLLSWIPDFQHLHLPEMFSPEEIQGRQYLFSQIVTNAERIILSSQNALQDFKNFAPQAVHKARVLSFVAQVPANIYDSDPAWVCEYYHLPLRFVYLPNQFWKHKNHNTVIQALALLKAQHPKITVICTGNTNEYRHPLYFAELLATISTLGLRDNLIILGLVPHAHLYQLMRQSLAVLQPSLFEGWSTTVEEAKSVGKRMILSDIPVHREQNPPEAIYFNPQDPQALADSLVRVFDESKPGPDYELEKLAQEQLPRRTQEFGRAFVKLVQEVVLP
jgi:glycosyltransferase involved in cell wall biosynthesis